MTTHRVTTIYPGLDVPVVEDCDCLQDVDHVEVYPTWSELFVAPVTSVVRRLRGRPARPDDRPDHSGHPDPIGRSGPSDRSHQEGI